MRTFTPRSVGPRASWPLLVIAAAASLSLAPRTADAQFGKLKKMGADAIKDAAKDKLGTDKKPTPATAGGAAAAATGATSGKKEAGMPKLDDDRIALVLASLAPQVKDAQIKANAMAVATAYEQKKKASESCMQNASKTVNPMSMAASAQKNEARITAMQKQSEAMRPRYAKAMEDGNFRQQILLEDSINVLTMRQAALSMGIPCTWDFVPVALAEAQALDRQGRGSNDRGEFDPGPAVTSVISNYEYGLLRERMALWALQQDNPALKGLGKQGTFSDDEQAALNKNAAEIKKLIPLFKSDALIWKTWSDLKSW